MAESDLAEINTELKPTTWLTWRGEKNYRGIVPVRGEDPYASEGYTTPQPWAHTAGAANRH